MLLVAISLVLGLVGAFAATRLLNSLLFGDERSGCAGVHVHPRYSSRSSRSWPRGCPRGARHWVDQSSLCAPNEV